MDSLPLVVTAPIKFEGTSARSVGTRLRAALSRRSVVIVDLSRTWVCDLAAIGELCLAHELAVARGAELRIVVSSGSIRNQFAVAELDAELHIYPSISLASGPES
jgi:anti-anti-sigma regulatory factor